MIAYQSWFDGNTGFGISDCVPQSLKKVVFYTLVRHKNYVPSLFSQDVLTLISFFFCGFENLEDMYWLCEAFYVELSESKCVLFKYHLIQFLCLGLKKRSLITLTTKRSSIVSCQEWPKTKCKCKPSSTVAKWACWSRHILQKHGTYFVCYCYSPSLFFWVDTGKEKPSVSCEIFLCVGITVFLLSVVSAFCFLCLMSSPQVLQAVTLSMSLLLVFSSVWCL